MPCCTAYGCSNRSDSRGVQDRSDSSQKRTYHKFPSDPERERQWLVNVRRQDFVPTKYSTLCSDHFEEWCFDRTGSIVRLRDTAVPTIFSFSTKSKNHRKRTISGGEINTGEPPHKRPAKDEGRTIIKKENTSEEDNVNGVEESITIERIGEAFPLSIKQEQFIGGSELIISELNEDSVITNDGENSITINNVSQNDGDSPEFITNGHEEDSNLKNVKTEKELDRDGKAHLPSKGGAKDKIVYLPDNRTYFEFATPKKKVILQLKPPKPEPAQLKTQNLEELIDSLKTRQVIGSEVQELLESFGELPQWLDNPVSKVSRSSKEPTEDLKKFASVLYTFAPKAFDLVEKKFALPDRQLLQDRLKVENYWPGFTQESLTLLKNKANKAPGDRICSIMMDSVDLKKQHCFDSKAQRWIGHLEFGGGQEPCDSDDIPLATQVLVFTAVGIGSYWKLPFGYFLYKGLMGEELQNLVLEAVSCLQDCGLSVRALVCEGSLTTVKMGTLLGCKVHTKLPNEMVTSFPSPSNKKQKIHLIFGFQHAFSLLRHLLEDKDILRSPIYGIIRWKFFKQLLASKGKSKSDRPKHADSEEREFYHLQNIIKLGSPGFNLAVSHALQLAEEKGINGYHGAKAAANFCADLYRAFDLLNSRTPVSREKPPLNPLFLPEQLESMSIIGQRIVDLELLSGSHVTKGGRWMSVTLLPFTLKSVGHLASELLTERAIPHLATYRLNLYHSTQILNGIEKRGRWDVTPTALQFQKGYKKLLTECFSLWSDSETYTNDFEGEDFTTGQGLSCPLGDLPDICKIAEEFDLSCSTVKEFNNSDIIAAKLVRHISQRLACTECVGLMVSDEDVEKVVAVNDAHLKPSKFILEILKISEKFLETNKMNVIKCNEERLVLKIMQRYVEFSTNFLNSDGSHINQEPHHVISLIKVFIRTFVRFKLNRFRNRCYVKSRLLQHSR